MTLGYVGFPIGTVDVRMVETDAGISVVIEVCCHSPTDIADEEGDEQDPWLLELVADPNAPFVSEFN